MANRPNQKLRLLHLAKIFFEDTDPENGLTTQALIERLLVAGYEVERKAVYRDIQALNQSGLCVRQKSGKEWYLASRSFNLDEIRLISDLIQHSPTLTNKITDDLLNKVESFASTQQRNTFHCECRADRTVKTNNDQVLTNVGLITRAIQKKKEIEFEELFSNEKPGIRDETSSPKTVLPCALKLNDGFYEVTAIDPERPVSNYRLDRMVNVKILDQVPSSDILKRAREQYDPSVSFMKPVVFEVRPENMSIMFDRFGTDLETFTKAGGLLRVYVKTHLNQSFFGWIIQHYPKIRLLSPAKAVESFEQFIKDVHRSCEEHQKLLAPGQFKELIIYLREELNKHIEENRFGTKFETEYAFCEVAANIVESWLSHQGIKDGMPHQVPTTLFGGRVFHGAINRWQYKSYGQTIGDAILAVGPRNFAQESVVDGFTDENTRYSESKGGAFVFTTLPSWMSWSGKYPVKIFYLNQSEHYELNLKETATANREALYVEGGLENADTRLEIPLGSWMDNPEGSGLFLAVCRHWQRHAYRFS